MTEQTTLRLDGKLAIITGAAGLIGSALAAGFAANGATVVLVDVDDARLQQLRDGIGGTAVGLACDLTDTPAVNRLVDTVVDRLGVPDILVNNAGGNHRMLPHLVTEEHWDRLVALNLTAPFVLSRAVGRHMIARRHGAIVNVTSTCGCSGMGRGNFVFSIAKAGLNAMTRELALNGGQARSGSMRSLPRRSTPPACGSGWPSRRRGAGRWANDSWPACRSGG